MFFSNNFNEHVNRLKIGLNQDVQAYLNEHLFRSFSHKSTVSVRQTTLRPRQLRRRMSCKGAIKKTRSINADSETLGMEGNVIERRTSSATLWSDARQHTAPSTSSVTSPISVPYSNIFVTPPDHDHRPHLERSHEMDKPEIGESKLSQIKDKHDGETQNSFFVSFKIGVFLFENDGFGLTFLDLMETNNLTLILSQFLSFI